ncbi:MAG: transketolase C-terminal domain-containing protein [bacterium]|nr:transketolase C-terminal domain-containing protein [bacterium]
MSHRTGLEVSHAAAEAVKLAHVEVVAAYPITPNTHVPERIAEMVANGELDAEFIPVESEHSAMSACVGSSATGARTFTATSGQGLELMHEVMTVASSMRLPIVLSLANRALSSPLSVWGDHSDVMAIRDCGWIQVFAENGQQTFDLLLWAFRVGEDPRVSFPVIVNFDGFHVTHVIEPVFIADQEEVDRYLPPFKPNAVLDPRRPVTMGAYGPPFIYSETKKAQDFALHKSKEVMLQGFAEFEKIFGRKYNFVETYKAEGAKTLLLVIGSFAETAMDLVDKLREKGEAVGLVRLRLWRPFPEEELRQAVRGAETLIVLDRAMSFGTLAPVVSEVRAALYPEEKRPQIVSFVGGLGGRDIRLEEFEYMVKRGSELTQKGGQKELYETIGIR